MNKYREALEGTHQLFRIRRIKRATMLALFLVAIVLIVYDMIYSGASLKPFYLPLNGVLAVVFLLAFIATLAWFVFRMMEIRYARRDSQRYLLVHNSVRRAQSTLVLALVFGILLALPITAEAANASVHENHAGSLDPNGVVTYTITNPDAFAVTHYEEGRVEVGGNGMPNLEVTAFVDGVSQGSHSASRNYPYVFTVFWDKYHTYNLTIRNTGGQRVTYQLILAGSIMPELTTVVPVILFGFAVANGVWIVYARPLRQKHAAASIYSVQYREEADAGQRTLAQYYRAPDPPSEAARYARPPRSIPVTPEPTPM